MVKNFKVLIVWQKAIELVTAVYELTNDFPDREKYGLANQLRRAVVSIPSNIAEGQGRYSTGEFKQFLGHARGSLYEVETQIILARKLNFIGQEQIDRIHDHISEVGRLMNGLITSLK